MEVRNYSLVILCFPDSIHDFQNFNLYSSTAFLQHIEHYLFVQNKFHVLKSQKIENLLFGFSRLTVAQKTKNKSA